MVSIESAKLCHRNSEISVMILPDSFFASNGLQSENVSLQFVRLRHPKFNTPSYFLLNHDSSAMREIFVYTEEHRCWFIGESVESNGRFLLASRMDPIFLLIPFLKRSSRLVPLDDLIDDHEYPDTNCLLRHPSMTKNLHRVAIPKGSPDMKVWQWNQEKAILYLAEKVERVANVLSAQKVDLGAGAKSESYLKNSLEVSISSNPGDYMRLALSIISDYLDVDLSTALEIHLKLPPLKKRIANSILTISNQDKKFKNSDSSAADDYSQRYKILMQRAIKEQQEDKSLNSKQKALLKSSRGTQSIKSFFINDKSREN